jgi:hypothetical protein
MHHHPVRSDLPLAAVMWKVVSQAMGAATATTVK